MSVQKLKRVLWRLRRRCPNEKSPCMTELERAIMYECGTCPKTIKENKKALSKLGWIKLYRGKRFELTDEDLIA
jgi:hypothetical protein